MKRVNKNGYAYAKPSELNRNISKKTNLVVFNNRRLNKSIVINDKKLKELLGIKIF